MIYIQLTRDFPLLGLSKGQIMNVDRIFSTDSNNIYAGIYDDNEHFPKYLEAAGITRGAYNGASKLATDVYLYERELAIYSTSTAPLGQKNWVKVSPLEILALQGE